jgi:hypothetical protein
VVGRHPKEVDGRDDLWWVGFSPLIVAWLTKSFVGFTVYPEQDTSQPLEYQDKVHGRDKGLLLGGQLLATYNDQNVWSLKRRQHVVKVAPGMDMLVALGMAYVRYDKLKDDANTAAVTVAVSS